MKLEARLKRLEKTLQQSKHAVSVFKFKSVDGEDCELKFLPGMTLAGLLAEAYRKECQNAEHLQT
ncbi:MAG: hypothetical protein HQ515_07685 [Phycisphaeraceae bacterium]|nr:hypothetical protein [Phycisphaeraceae bacterium]